MVPATLTTSGVPSIAWATIGSAFGSVEATAIGAAPTRAIPIAARAARERKAYDGLAVNRSHRRAGRLGGRDRHRCIRGDRHPRHREVAGGEDERHRDHAVGVRADPAEEAEVLDEHPVGEAENDAGDDGHADHGRPARSRRRSR